jgi:uncharacterized membrane protein YgcG
MAAVVALQLDRESFPLVACAACGTRALTYLDPVDESTDVRRCLACDAVVGDAALQLSGSRAVEALGYVFIDRARRALSKKKLSGCGAAGVKSCGSGGCSSGGSCGTGGGCSSGGCGSK